MIKDPDISIIIVSWNTRDLLMDCLRSVIEAVRDITAEIIVSDNGSTDGTIEMLEIQFPDVWLLKNGRNLGFSAANNKAFPAASGRYIFFLNTDTLVSPDAIKILVSFLDDHKEAGAVGPQLLNFDGSLQPSGWRLPGLKESLFAVAPIPRLIQQKIPGYFENRNFSLTTTVGELSGAALMVKREVLEQVGGYDESFFFLGEDIDLCWRIQKAGWKIYYLPSAKIKHLWGGSSQGQSEIHSLLNQRAYLRLLLKHRPKSEAILFFFTILGTTTLKMFKRTGLALLRREWKAGKQSLLIHLKEIGWILKNGLAQK